MRPVKSTTTKWVMGMPKVFSIVCRRGRTGPVVERGVDLLGPVQPAVLGQARHLHPGVAGDREELGGARLRVDVEDLDGVAALPPASYAVPNDLAAWPVLPARVSEPMISTLNGEIGSSATAARRCSRSSSPCPTRSGGRGSPNRRPLRGEDDHAPRVVRTLRLRLQRGRLRPVLRCRGTLRPAPRRTASSVDVVTEGPQSILVGRGPGGRRRMRRRRPTGRGVGAGRCQVRPLDEPVPEERPPAMRETRVPGAHGRRSPHDRHRDAS